MKIGCPTEIKVAEGRVGLSPAGTLALVMAGHEVFIQRNAGVKAGFTDEDYAQNGATIVDSKEAVYARADMIVKVKEPQPAEWPLIRPGQIIFAYFHFSSDKALATAMRQSEAVCFAYESVEVGGKLPLLEPMSQVAGKMSIQCGMHFLETPFGGSGVLLGGLPGVRRGRVLVLGGGVVGAAAASVAAGVGADVVVLDTNVERLRYLESTLPRNVSTRFSSEAALLLELPRCDLLVGAVLLPAGRKAPKLVKREHLKLMKPGSVIVDVAVDQGGCVETTHPTTHESPVYVIDGIVHYGVTNMPGAVAQTSSVALSNATLQYTLQIAEAGWREACRRDAALLRGLNMAQGKVFLAGVAEAFNWDLSPTHELWETGKAVHSVRPHSQLEDRKTQGHHVRLQGSGQPLEPKRKVARRENLPQLQGNARVTRHAGKLRAPKRAGDFSRLMDRSKAHNKARKKSLL